MLNRSIVFTFVLGLGVSSVGLLAGCGQKGPLYLPASSGEKVSEQAGDSTIKKKPEESVESSATE